MGIYDFEIEPGVKIKAKLIDNPTLVHQNICELYSTLKTPVAGLDVKLHSSFWPWIGNQARMLILCVANRCLIIQLAHLDVFPHILKKILADDKICFVGRELGRKLATLPRVGNNNNYNNAVTCNTGVEVGDLAARVLKKPYISELGLAYLANEAGVNLSVVGMVFSSAGATGGSPWIDYSARAFTEEEIKCVIREAYTCYAIGNKLLNML